jgi:hypothetical protein
VRSTMTRKMVWNLIAHTADSSLPDSANVVLDTLHYLAEYSFQP